MQKWFKKFKNGDQALERKEGTGKLNFIFSNNELLELVDMNPYMTLKEYGQLLNVSAEAIRKRFKILNYTRKRTLWVPHNLTALNKQKRVSTCMFLLEQHQKAPFLRRMVTMDEKWVLYVNVTRRCEWSIKGKKPGSSAKPGLHPQKVMLSIWWDCKGT